MKKQKNSAVNPFAVVLPNGEFEKVHASLGVSDERNDELAGFIKAYLNNDPNSNENGWGADFAAITKECKNANELAYMIFMYTHNVLSSQFRKKMEMLHQLGALLGK